ncbi:Fic/DOC family protein [Aestuariirhabdus sp. LZHN29]|uniref:Fic/DOC family protein n=1 Tax=Aestuariirhabdus sp. LZHN29 TaxID=3417462 RepID=UPI003CF93D4F
MVGKYGTGDDPDCYPDSKTLINHLNIQSSGILEQAEREITEISASEIDFAPPPYDLNYLRQIHKVLFQEIYPWAGEIRQIDIAKGATRFCSCARIIPEADKLFAELQRRNYYIDLEKSELIGALAELYGNLNVVHPFREGNGRTQRILFEHLTVNCGWEIRWESISEQAWVQASIDSYHGDCRSMETIFKRCVGSRIGAS